VYPSGSPNGPVCAEISGALADRRDYHLVVIASTVPPQSNENELLPALEGSSGKMCGRDFGLCYAPEFVALGAVIERFLRPKFALIGEYDARSGDRLAEIYAGLFEVSVEIVRTNIVSAEIAKLAVNNFVAAKISFANLLARLCERVPGADVDAVTSVLQRDPRIGAGFPRGALSYGGPCLPRDVAALTRLAAALDLEASFPTAVARINGDRLDDLARAIRQAADAAEAVSGERRASPFSARRSSRVPVSPQTHAWIQTEYSARHPQRSAAASTPPRALPSGPGTHRKDASHSRARIRGRSTNATSPSSSTAFGPKRRRVSGLTPTGPTRNKDSAPAGSRATGSVPSGT
jgi:hypothetical protein